MIQVSDAGLPGLLLVEPTVHRDGRGFFLETIRTDELRAAGIDQEFMQHNHSRSTRGTVRGLHFQAPPGQAKLVRVARGAISTSRWTSVVDPITLAATWRFSWTT